MTQYRKPNDGRQQRSKRSRLAAAILGTTTFLLLQPCAQYQAVGFSTVVLQQQQQQLVAATAAKQTTRQPQHYSRRSLIPAFMSSSVSNKNEESKDEKKSTERNLVLGRWEELHGNYLLRPPLESGSSPRALLHFLGGALVGESPHLFYRYVLESLSEKGYLVVATPFHLSFDYISTCDAVIDRFERIAPMLARQYGAVPVVGVGHSCGSLLQLLITSLFPDTPRAANALISFNNKPVKEAVPFFDEVFAPLFASIGAKQEDGNPSGTERLSVILDLARNLSKGELPSDEQLRQLTKYAMLSPTLAEMMPPLPAMPDAVRNVLQSVLVDPYATALSQTEALAVLNQLVNVAEQIPLLIDEVADGARDFIPPPNSIKAAAKRAYRARRTLILQYDNDGIDESEVLEEILKEAESVTRMKRPMTDIDIQRKVLQGGHASPVLAPPLALASRLEDVLGEDEAKERLLYAQADATVNALVAWLEEASL